MNFIYIFISVVISIYVPIGGVIYYFIRYEKKINEEFEKDEPEFIINRVSQIKDEAKKMQVGEAVLKAVLTNNHELLVKYSDRVNELLKEQREKVAC